MVLSRFRRASTRMWLIAYLLLRAVVITTLGILLLIRPHETVHRVAAFVGWVLIVLAVIDVLAAAYGPDRVTRRLLWVRAAFTAIVGLVLALLTTVSVTAVAVLIAMYLVVTGGVSVILGIHLRSEIKAWIGMAVRGGLALVAGILALVWPRLTIVVVAVILGVHWLVGGLVSLSTAVGVWLESRGAGGKSAPSQPEPSAPAGDPAVTSPSEGDSDKAPQGGGVETSSDQRQDVSLEDR
ncbi:MAG: DUF308 domain-containing protein [Acidimicrobiia bacterium]